MTHQEDKNRAVFIIDDNEDTQASLRVLLEISEYAVLQASSMEEANSLTPRLLELGVKVVIVDGNLSGENLGDNQDGTEIIARIKHTSPQIQTIGHASQGDVPGADLQSPKPNGPQHLLETIKTAFRTFESTSS